jgi:hypothetical protein
MKKKVIVICCVSIIVVLVLFVLFNKLFVKKTDLKNIYLDVVNNKTTFLLNNKKMKIEELFNGDEEYIDFYSFVDYGNDSHLELFVSLIGLDGKSYIFNSIGKNIYAYELDEFVTSNTVDGYSSFSGTTTGWAKYTFSNKKLKKEILISRDNINKKCTYKTQDYDCDSIIQKQVELLKSIGENAEEIKVPNNKRI